MIKLKTMLESAIDRRNYYQGRLIENMTNVLYFTKKISKLKNKRSKLKVDSEDWASVTAEIKESEGNLRRSTINIEEDQLLLEAFGDLIKNLKNEKKGN
jgi:hypothetical protein